MEPQKKDAISLQQRVSKILHSDYAPGAEDVYGDDALGVIIDMLEDAETELATAEERVNRLKWQLSKAETAAGINNGHARE